MTTAPPPRPAIVDPGLAVPGRAGTGSQAGHQNPGIGQFGAGVWERQWPGAVGAPRPVVLGAVAVAAGVTASVVPLDRPGLGWLVATVAGVAALTTAAVARPRPPATSSAPTPPGAPSTALTPSAAPPVSSAARTPAPTAPGTASTSPAPTPSAPTGVPEKTAATGGADAAARPDATGASGRAARVAWAVATVALVGVGSVRAAGWLFALCLIAAIGTASLAVAGGRTPLGMLVAAVLPPIASVRALPWAARGLPRSGPAGPSVGRSLASMAVTIVLLLLFGLLFSSADAVFADLVADALPDTSAPDALGWFLRLLLVGAVLLGGAYLLAAPPDLDGLRAGPARTVRRLEWVLPLALLDALFAAFVLVQLTVLFGGSGHVLRTAGLTYAEYARGGFWQLLAVSALTLLVIAGATRWAPRGARADRILIRVLIGGLTALSLVIVASALYRMRVYTDAYGATRLRLVVATVELWLGLLFVLVGVATIRLRGGWLPRLVLGAAVVALLGLAVVNPDRLIAEHNVDRYQRMDRLDVGYLSRLSADAVPALDRLPEPVRSCALRDIAAQLFAEDGWRGANVGRARARALLGPEPAEASVEGCPNPRW